MRAGLRALPHPPDAEDPLAFQRPHRLLRRSERGAPLLQRRRTNGTTTTACWALGSRNCWLPPTRTPPPAGPRQCGAIRTCLDRLAQYEAKGSEDLDAVSGCFGELMAELFDYQGGPLVAGAAEHRLQPRQVHLPAGRLRRPRSGIPAKGRYNPLRSLSQTPGYEEEMREIFELLLARCARSFERLPCVEDVDLLRNILYSGVWLKYNCKRPKRPEAQNRLNWAVSS